MGRRAPGHLERDRGAGRPARIRAGQEDHPGTGKWMSFIHCRRPGTGNRGAAKNDHSEVETAGHDVGITGR